jgi:hypothetical protein
MTDNVSTLLESLHDTRKQKAELDKLEKTILAELKPVIDPVFDTSPDAPITSGNLILARISGLSRTISADLLLERGVAPDIVSYATKTTTFFQYRVKEAKNG